MQKKIGFRVLNSNQVECKQIVNRDKGGFIRLKPPVDNEEIKL